MTEDAEEPDTTHAVTDALIQGSYSHKDFFAEAAIVAIAADRNALKEARRAIAPVLSRSEILIKAEEVLQSMYGPEVSRTDIDAMIYPEVFGAIMDAAVELGLPIELEDE
jgi:hypothetical protein